MNIFTYPRRYVQVLWMLLIPAGLPAFLAWLVADRQLHRGEFAKARKNTKLGFRLLNIGVAISLMAIVAAGVIVVWMGGSLIPAIGSFY